VVKDCAESVTVANPVMNAIAGIQVGDLNRDTLLNESRDQEIGMNTS
jgi:hypothetical protein